MNSLIEKYKMYGFSKFFSFVLAEMRNIFFMQFIKGSYSQYGEDLVLDKLLGYKKEGFYVDIGAYDPHRFCNTKKFYLRGWHGINIEPNPKLFNKFITERVRDINLNIGIGRRKGKAVFYQFFPDTLSTLSNLESNRYLKQGYILENKFKIDIDSLSNILGKYTKGINIDFFSIDTEGYDLEVLKSNNWNQFRPKFICIESISLSMENNVIKNTKLHKFLVRTGYKKVYDNGVNSIYQNGK